MAYAYGSYAGAPGFYDYSTSASNSPAPEEGNIMYSIPQFQTPTGKRHHRTNSYHTPGSRSMYSSPAHYPSPAFYADNYNYSSPPPQRYDYVSVNKSSTRKSRQSVDDAYARFSASTRSPPKQRIHVGAPVYASDQSDDDSPVYHEIRPVTRPGRANTASKRRPVSSADIPVIQGYDTSVDAPVRSRARRATASYGTPKKPSTPKASKPQPVAPEATAADAIKHNIPAGYSLKNWDPTEEPILLLGSAFDANSLGKWIYDWTVYHHSAGAPLTEVAGELWLLLIKFSGKMKRAEECAPRVRNADNRDLMNDFLKSGDRIWGKMKGLLKICEDHMWKGAKKESGKVSMGEKSGVEFVKTIFGRERELERTEKLMNSIRLWNMRFDANCEEILRRPSAK